MKDKYAALPDEVKNPPMFFDFDGNPIGLRTWTRLFEEADRQLALTEVTLSDGTPARVSTIWMGINRAFIDGGEINIFETGVLTATELLYEVKSSTRAKALADHEHMVAFVGIVQDLTPPGHETGCLGNHQGDCAVSGWFSQSHAYDAERARDDFRWEAEQ